MTPVQVPMLRIYTCKKCRSVYVVSEKDQHIELLKKIMRCPNAQRCAGKIRVYANSNIPVSGSLKVTAVHLYQASMGAGLPDERRCSPKEVRQMLLGATVTGAELEAAPDPHRSLLLSMTLSTGKTLHIASSTKGATIYKVTEER